MVSKNSLDLIKDIKNITGIELPSEERGGVSDANIVSSVGVITLDGFVSPILSTTNRNKT